MVARGEIADGKMYQLSDSSFTSRTRTRSFTLIASILRSMGGAAYAPAPSARAGCNERNLPPGRTDKRLKPQARTFEA